LRAGLGRAALRLADAPGRGERRRCSDSVPLPAEESDALSVVLRSLNGSSAALSGGSQHRSANRPRLDMRDCAATLPHPNVQKTRDLGPGGYRTPSASAVPRPQILSLEAGGPPQLGTAD